MNDRAQDVCDLTKCSPDASYAQYCFISLGIGFISNHWMLQHGDKISSLHFDQKTPMGSHVNRPHSLQKRWRTPNRLALGINPLAMYFIHWKNRTLSPMRPNSHSSPPARCIMYPPAEFPLEHSRKPLGISMKRPSYGQGTLAFPLLCKLRLM